MFYDEYLQIMKNKKDRISYQHSLNILAKKLMTSENDFKRSISHLSPDMQLFLYDSNICVYYPRYNEAALFYTSNFNETVFIYDKQTEYSYIKDYLFTTSKLFNKLSDIDRNFYQQMLQLITVPPIQKHYVEPEELTEIFPTEDSVNFLYHLTCGDIKSLYDFGRVCGQLLFRKNTRPAVVLTNLSIHKELKKFFCNLERKTYEFDIKKVEQ